MASGIKVFILILFLPDDSLSMVPSSITSSVSELTERDKALENLGLDPTRIPANVEIPEGPSEEIQEAMAEQLQVCVNLIFFLTNYFIL